MEIREALIEELVRDINDPEDLLGEKGLLKHLRKRLIEKMLEGELSHHLGYKKYAQEGKNKGNSRNGSSKKTIKSEQGETELEIPRDREGSFEPILIPKGKTRVKGFDDKIISLYARGLTTRDIQGHIKEIYDVEISPSLVSQITDTVRSEAEAWQNRGLDKIYPIIYFDAIVVKVRDEDTGRVINKAAHLVLGVNIEGYKEILGIWITENEGAKFWLRVCNELRNRGVQDIFIACCDGLIGLPDAIEAVFPNVQVQLCIVHMVRNSLKYVSYKDYKALCKDLRNIYNAFTLKEAERQLEVFSDKWDNKYPQISQLWLRHWDRVTTFFAYTQEIRRVIYTTNPIESVNRSLRKVTKNRGSFPNEDSVIKLFYLALGNISKKWTQPIRDWKPALNQFSIMFEGRMV